MATITPATNVQVAAVAGFLSAIIEHICKSNGVDIPDDVSAGLPAVVAVLVAHFWDMATGGNAKPALPATVAEMKAAENPK